MKIWLSPRQYERRYGRFLKKNIAELKAEFLRRLGRVRRFKPIASKPVDDEEMVMQETVSENESEQIDSVIAAMFAWWATRRVYAAGVTAGYFREVNEYNDKQFRLVVKDLTGLQLPPSQVYPYEFGTLSSPTDQLITKLGDVDIHREEVYLTLVRENWEKVQDVYLDKTVTAAISDLELILRNGVVISAGTEVISTAIDKKIETVGNRVERSGQDQVSSLDSQLTRERQLSIGAKDYDWLTMRDERVRGNPYGLYPNARPSHYAREGVTFDWDRPPEGGHPGEAPGCRCRARMRLPR